MSYFRRVASTVGAMFLAPASCGVHVFAAQVTSHKPLSSAERFKIFSSASSDGDRYMNPSDFVRSLSITRLNQSSSDTTSTDQPEYLQKLFASIDSDGDGKLNYNEYCLFFVLLTNSEEELRLAFEMMDTTSSGYIDIEGFTCIIKSLAEDPTLRLTFTSGFTQMLFGPMYEKRVTLRTLTDLVHKVRHDVWLHEFNQLDSNKSGYISLLDLHQFIFGSKVSHEESVIPFSTLKVTFSTYKTFNNIILHSSDVVHALKLLQDGGTPCTKKDFNRALKLSGVEITNSDVEVVFQLFDLNGNGIIDVAEFEEVVTRRKCFNTAPVDRTQPSRSVAQDFFYCMQQRSE